MSLHTEVCSGRSIRRIVPLICLVIGIAFPAPAQPVLQVNPATLDFTLAQGGAPSTRAVNVTTNTGQQIIYTTRTLVAQPWLSVSVGGTTGLNPLTVTVNPASLQPGSTSAIVLVEAQGAVSAQLVVNLTVTGSTTLFANPGSLSFLMTLGGSTPSAQMVTLTSGTPVSFTAVPDQSWLVVQPVNGTTGTTTGTLTASVNSVGLGKGTYSANIVVSPAVGGQLLIPVTFTIGAGSSVLSADPSSLLFAAPVGGSAPAAKTINITSNTGSPIQFVAIASSTPRWLTVDQSATGTPATLTVRVDQSGLSAGLYNGSIGVFGGGQTPSELLRIPVVLNVGGTPSLTLTANSLNFAYSGGTLPASQTLSVGGGSFAFSAVAMQISTANGQQWLSINLTSGAAPSSILVSANPAGMPAGVYQGQVTVTAAAGTPNSPQSVIVTLTITGGPSITLNPGSLSFNFQPGGSTPSAQAIVVGTTLGSAQFSATATQNSGSTTWLIVGPTSGATPATLNVSVNPAGLAAGTYTGSVNVTVSGASNSPQSVGVTLVVQGPSTIAVNPDLLLFSASPGGGISPPQSVSIASTGSSPMSYTITVDAGSWLVLSPPAGTTASTPGGFNVSVNPSSLNIGIYNGKVIVTPASGGPRVVNVTLTVGTTQSLSVSPPSMAFAYVIGGPAPPSQSLLVSSSTTGPIQFFATTTSSNNWLSAAPGSSLTPVGITISLVQPALAALSAGTYTGNITITASGVTNSPIVVPVTLVVSLSTAATILSVNPASFNLAYEVGTGAPAAQALLLSTNSSAALGFTATAGGSWLSVNPASGNVPAGGTPASVGVSVNPSELGPGTYNASITIAVSGTSNSPITVPVTLTVTPGVTASASPASLTFVQTGANPPPAQTISVACSGASLSFSAATTGSNFLSVSPASGSVPGTLSVSVNPGGLASGTYSGAVLVTVSGATNNPLTIPVSFTIESRLPSIAAVVSAGSLTGGFAAPGAIVSVFGRRMGPDEGISLKIENGFVGTTLGEVRLLADGVAAPLTYASARQINAILPFSVSGKSSVQLEIDYEGRRSPAMTLALADASPALFTADASGQGQGAILNQDNSTNSAANPAERGSVVVLFGTGGGRMEPAPQDGQVISGGVLPKPILPVTAMVGGNEAEVLYAGAAPDLVAGVLQINVRVPAGARPGMLPVLIKAGRFSSQLGVTVAVK